MALKRQSAGPGGRARRPPERREIHALQPHHRIAPRDRHRHCRNDARRESLSRRSGRTWAFTLVDTGGMFGASEDPLHRLVVRARATGRRRRLRLSCSSSTAAKGLVPGDEEDRRQPPQRGGVPSSLAVNKTDDQRARGRAVEFYKLGFEPVVEIAAEHGEGRAICWTKSCHRLPAGGRIRPVPGRRIRQAQTHAHDPDRPDHPASSRSWNGKPRSPSSGARTWASRRCSIGSCRKSARSSATCRAPLATRSTRSCTWHRRTLPHRRHRRHTPAGPRGTVRPARIGERRWSRSGRSRRPTWRCSSSTPRRSAPTRTPRSRGEAEKAGCGVIIAANKWDLMKGRGAEFSKEFDDKLRQPGEVPRLRAAPAHLGRDRRARRRKVARDHRQGRRSAACGESRPES